jgi:hypothetical protein
LIKAVAEGSLVVGAASNLIKPNSCWQQFRRGALRALVGALSRFVARVRVRPGLTQIKVQPRPSGHRGVAGVEDLEP